MTLRDAVRIGKHYRDLGWAVQDQLDKLLADGYFEDLNISALAMIHEFLTQVSDGDGDDEAGDLAEEILGYVQDAGKTIRYGRIVNA